MRGIRRTMPQVNFCLLGVLISLVLLGVGASESAVAADLHEFNPTLSLTGGCGKTAIDPVPDPSCPGGPPAPFAIPKSVATDSYGDIFVISAGFAEPEGSEGRIDIFDSEGFYITEIGDSAGPRNIAVDSEGNLYVFNFRSGGLKQIVRYKPSLYNPGAGEISYGNAPEVVAETGASFLVGLAVNPSNDHLFANLADHVVEFGSAKEANVVIDEKIGEGTLKNEHGIGLAIDAAHKRIYASDIQKVRVFELEPPHKLLMTIDESAVPAGGGLTSSLSLAVDEGTGHFFIYNGGGTNVVYELDEAGNYVSTINHNIQHVFGAEIAVDNGKNSPNGALNPFGRFLFVPSHPTGTGHMFAFGPAESCAPVVQESSFTGVTENEAELRAVIDPCFLDTSYIFEYTTKEQFEAEGFAHAEVGSSGLLSAGGAPVEVSALLDGLSSETAYVFEVRAENEKGIDSNEGEFVTYAAGEPSPPCPNALFRTGLSASLPDCRAYELVTPPDTNARTPMGVGHLGSAYFATREASPIGNAVSFEIEGGSIPGYEATGSYAGDPYVSRRSAEGWITEYAGPTGEESPALLPGSNSPDQGYSFWSTAGGEGTAAIEEKLTTYVRYPDGHSALVGRGSLGTDPQAQGILISESGNHIIFVSGTIGGPSVHLEEDAPPDGTRTIYDRTANETTHVISLLPHDETPAGGENAFYEGASLDGKGVAFRIGSGLSATGPLYLRYNDEDTYEIAGPGATFAGIAEGGKRIFYLEDNNLYAYEVEGEGNPIAFSSSGNVTPVNVAPDGNAAYFVSPSVLVGEPNPQGDLPVNGQQNLYRSEEGAITFVGTVTKLDVEGEGEGSQIGLGFWMTAVGPGQLGRVAARTTPDGQALLFESRAPLTGYDSEGHTEIYRYDAVTRTLQCLSCSPTLTPATGDASLQSISLEKGAPEPFSFFALVNNLKLDGRRAFFQSTEPLVLADTDGLQDVYEWEDRGVGSCKRAGGCIYLISSGQSDHIDYLYAVSDSGDDVFFRSSDLLVGRDTDETPSIYDAKVGGGFANELEGSCEGEGCHPQLSTPPAMLGPESGIHVAIPKGRTCPKGKHKIIHEGKVRCIKKRHRHSHRRAGGKVRGAAK